MGWRAALVLGIAAMTAGSLPAAADPLIDAPVRSYADVTAFSVDGNRVAIQAKRWAPTDPTEFCVWIDHREETDELLTVLYESGCQTGNPYRFDPITWEATASGRIETSVHTWVYERAPDGWSLIHSEETRSYVSADLAFVGTGAPLVQPPSVGVATCFLTIVCPYIGSAVVERSAVVTGSIEFERLARSVTLSDHPGVLRMVSH
jgi:hypothetical protein